MGLASKAKSDGTNEGALPRTIRPDNEIEAWPRLTSEMIVGHEVVDLDLDDVPWKVVIFSSGSKANPHQIVQVESG